MTFLDKLQAAWKNNDSLVCVGLDPDPVRFPPHLASHPDAVFEFCREIVDATADQVCAFKPQFAHFAAIGATGALLKLVTHIRTQHPGIPVILDAKRGDIGTTAEMYAREAFDHYQADALTVNPYLGGDTLKPYTSRTDKGVIVLCRTSNPGAGELQDLVCSGTPVYEIVADLAAREWNGNGNVLLVVGATYPQELGVIREIVGDMPLLVPGIGAQGGDVEAVMKMGRNAFGTGLIISSSREIIYAGNGEDFAQKSRAAAAMFVVLWSSGFIIAKLALPYSPPLTFLVLRFVLVLAVLAPVALVLHAPWPRGARQIAHLAITGALLHGAYLAGVFCAIAHGMSAGLTALIVGIQPILTGLAGRLIGERVSGRQWLGLLLGFCGVALVLAGRTSAAGVNTESIALAVLGLLGITGGTLYQKRFGGAMDLRTGSIVQFAAATVVLAPFAWLSETPAMVWTGELVFALAWSVVVMSLGAISLLVLLIRRGAATSVSSLFYLTPPTTAVMAYVIFGEVLTPLALLGLVMTVGGVALVVRK